MSLTSNMVIINQRCIIVVCSISKTLSTEAVILPKCLKAQQQEVTTSLSESFER